MIKPKYDYIVATGGIGKGILFRFDKNETLGRNESRLATLTDFKDYCKQHIILHYVAKLAPIDFNTFAIGSVGADETGKELKAFMQRSGINVDYVKEEKLSNTLYAVCFLYPNGEGGNISSQNNACSLVTKEQIAEFFAKERLEGNGIVLSVPEVPLEARIEILKQGRKNGCLNVASILSMEAESFQDMNGFELVDLLAINQDEAEAIAKLSKMKRESIEDTCVNFLHTANEKMTILITKGKDGVFTYHNGNKYYTPAIANMVESTAGAGDCFIGSTISGLIHGIDLISKEKKGVFSSVDIGTLAASKKVSCKDTIDVGISKYTLEKYAILKNIKVSEEALEHYFKRK